MDAMMVWRGVEAQIRAEITKVCASGFSPVGAVATGPRSNDGQ